VYVTAPPISIASAAGVIRRNSSTASSEITSGSASRSLLMRSPRSVPPASRIAFGACAIAAKSAASDRGERNVCSS
jgi:hypothetical protein